jgi:hypothetical protein
VTRRIEPRRLAMSFTTRIPFLLAATLAVVPACDEELDADLLDEEEIGERCVGGGCTVGGIGNTSRIGDHALSNLSRTFNTNANNISSRVRITGASGYYGTTKMTATEIDVEADGELRLKLGTAGWIQGTAVKNASFDVVVTPNSASLPAFAGKLLIVDVACAPGKVDPTMTICKYEFVTNVKPSDTITYPPSTKAAGYYHACPNEDENGLLDSFERYAAVLSPQVSLSATSSTTPRIDPFSGQFILGCLNGAVSKGQYHLNAFYDASAYRGLEPSQRSAMLLMWMAWHAGASRTTPGMIISPHDPIKGLFTWTNDPTYGIEGGYVYNGAACRGGPLTTGLHRLFDSPVTTLTGWSALPYCSAGNIGSMAVLGVKTPM